MMGILKLIVYVLIGVAILGLGIFILRKNDGRFFALSFLGALLLIVGGGQLVSAAMFAGVFILYT